MSQKRLYILSGGAGTRLWPLSRESNPKQFHDLAHAGHSLLVESCQRLKSFGDLYILTTEALRFPSLGILKRYQIPAQVVGEPQPRNTAPAVALATLQSLRADPESLIGIFPADHLIENAKYFSELLNAAFELARQNAVVTIGIEPHYPATAYGYIQLDQASSPPGTKAFPVKAFIEKPALPKAEELLKSRTAVWNAGIFVFSAKVMAGLFQEHMPDLWKALSELKSDESNLKDIYPKLPKLSVDYGIMEKAKNLLCMPAKELGWSDVGSWEEVSRLAQISGNPIEIDGGDNFYTGVIPDHKRVAFVGVSNLIAVDTPDALLIMRKGEGQKVREVVERLHSEKSTLPQRHDFEERPWGRFEVLIDSAYFKSKKISMWPGQRLSYQSHSKRAEHWVIVKGVAEVTLDDVPHSLKAGDHIFIPLKAKHRISNPGLDVMEFIEVQTGSYFGEDDIVRYQDDYGRG